MPHEELKICLIGSSGSGKTSIITRLIMDSFGFDGVATIGSDIFWKTFHINDRQIRLQIWDTAGQEQQRSFVQMYYRCAKGFAVVYDTSEEESISQVAYWIMHVKRATCRGVKIFVVGNKTDLRPHPKVRDVEEYTRLEGLVHVKTSAKSGENIQELFETIARCLAPVEFNDVLDGKIYEVCPLVTTVDNHEHLKKPWKCC